MRKLALNVKLRILVDDFRIKLGDGNSVLTNIHHSMLVFIC